MDDFEKLVGKTIMRIEGAEVGSENIAFYCSDGAVLTLFHSPDCCETVEVNEIHGDIADLIGAPVTLAEVVVNENEPQDGKVPEYPDSWTWTFYKLATMRGYVTLRWLGESNGYYSERVNSYWKGLADA